MYLKKLNFAHALDQKNIANNFCVHYNSFMFLKISLLFIIFYFSLSCGDKTKPLECEKGCQNIQRIITSRFVQDLEEIIQDLLSKKEEVEKKITQLKNRKNSELKKESEKEKTFFSERISGIKSKLSKSHIDIIKSIEKKTIENMERTFSETIIELESILNFYSGEIKKSIEKIKGEIFFQTSNQIKNCVEKCIEKKVSKEQMFCVEKSKNFQQLLACFRD